MNIDYSKIITDNFKLLVDNERLNTIKKEALNERAKIKTISEARNSKSVFYSKASEIAYVSYRHQTKSNAEKGLLAANIAFDDQEFSTILLNGGFNKNNLETFIKLLGYLKSKIANETIDSVDEKYKKTAEKYARMLQKHFTMYVGKCDLNIIINKINEILSYKSELIEEEEQTKTK